MITLNFDPGAERMGWSVLEAQPDSKGISVTYIDSGITECKREADEDYQPYKLRLIKFWTFVAPAMIEKHKPDVIVSEILPAVGGGNFVVATQSELAKAAVTVIHSQAFWNDIPVYQVGATTVKKVVGGKSKATKVGVRNGVIALFPELAPRRVDWIKVFDESDAIAIGATHLMNEYKDIKWL